MRLCCQRISSGGFSFGLLPIARALQGVDHVVALLRAPMERLVEATRLSVKPKFQR